MPSYHINRSSKLQHILQQSGWAAAAPDAVADFSMWFPCERPCQARCSQFDPAVTRLLDDKLNMYKLLREYGEEAITPRVFSKLPAYLEFLKQDQDGVFCFLKTTHGAGGSEVFFFNTLKALLVKLQAISDMQGTAIIQQGIRDVALIDERKFKIRTYVLVDSKLALLCI